MEIVIRFLIALIFTILCLNSVIAQTVTPHFQVCHGYVCQFRTSVNLSHQNIKHLRALFLKVHNGAQEREAIRHAVAIFEERSTEIIGFRDQAKMAFGWPNRKGQMDCVDESINTTAFLSYLESANFLKYHKISKRDSRGLFIDGRYPHWTAVIMDNKKTKWAVDSWYEVGGGKPDILPLKDWKSRGYHGKR